MTRDLAIRFSELFTGRDDALGFSEGRVERRRVTLEDYRQHLAGGQGIGIFPMRDDNTVRFAAIDLDEPNFELARTMQKLIPGASWIERSRSGNAHVWVFFADDVPAWVARTILKGATEAVGRPDVEIFPKQDQLREGMVGNYINLPYHGDERPVLLPDYDEAEDVQFSLAGFLLAAEGKRSDPATWGRRARGLGGKPPEEREETSEWGTAPYLHECAELIIRHRRSNPIREGGRHQVLFHLAVQLLNWEGATREWAWDRVVEVNADARPPLPEGELRRLFRNAYEGQYTFTGCDDPAMAPYVSPDCPIAKGEVGR